MKQFFCCLIALSFWSSLATAYSYGGLLEGKAGELKVPIEGNAEPVLQLECGGVLTIPYDRVTYVEYKYGQHYDPSEFCVWIVTSTDNIWQSLNATLEFAGFENGLDGLQAYHLTVTAAASSPKLGRCAFTSGTTPSTCQLPNEVAFLAFSSSGSSTSGTGFRLRLEPVGFYSEPVFTGFHINDSQGVVSYPSEGGSYRNNERVAFAFQLNGPNTIELTRLQTEGIDSVSFFTIFPFQDNAEPRLDGKYAGVAHDEADRSFADSPRLAFFYSDASFQGFGFDIKYSSGAQTLGCGGTIEVGPGFPTIVEYRFEETYENNEFCVWGITSVGGWGFVTIVIESDGTESCCDGVEGYYVNTTSTTRDIGLEKCDFEDGRCFLRNGIGFLTFTSDRYTTGRGFRAVTTYSGQPTVSKFDSVIFHNETFLTFQYPGEGLYSNNERALILLQENTIHTTEVIYLRSEASSDYLHLFTIYPKWERQNATVDARYTGQYPTGVGEVIRRQYPQVALFVTDSSTVDYGFALTVRESSTAVKAEKPAVQGEEARMDNGFGKSSAVSNGKKLSMVKRKAAV